MTKLSFQNWKESVKWNFERLPDGIDQVKKVRTDDRSYVCPFVIRYPSPP